MLFCCKTGESLVIYKIEEKVSKKYFDTEIWWRLAFESCWFLWMGT